MSHLINFFFDRKDWEAEKLVNSCVPTVIRDSANSL